MDNEKEIEEMTSKIIGNHVGGFDFGTEYKVIGYITSKEIATILCNEGYGNVEKAVKEFAEELKKRAGIEDETYGKNVVISYTELDDFIKEHFGKEELK